MVAQFKKVIRKIVFSIITPEVQYVKEYEKNTYSQAGEDVVMKFLFNDRKVDSPSYLDIGTNSPDDHNNTYLFYKRGSSGVCVEANQALIEVIKEVRPRDKVINVGVGVTNDTEADFYMFDDSALNTFSQEEAEYRETHGTCKISKIVKVKLRSVNNIISESFSTYPDLLSLDIEGLDLEVLKTLDFNTFSIPVICVETCKYSENHIRPKDTRIFEFMVSRNYEVYADTYINTIFVNKAWFYS